ncbi:MAG TPA: isoaspartyl peptidase/L-asparaginase family protein, partial [Kofleriaceae bacterium]|nr:isoaspartyl peptidase/L-asparaginase family protein [Kofleriaceae bacterium]
MVRPAIVVHGGAGDLDPALAGEARAGCERAARAGLAVMAAGRGAVEAVWAAVRVLEDDPLFNAGTGSALTRDGTVECDAALMDGATVRIGGVAAMASAPEAISIARAVLEDGEHALLCGEGAWEFARARGFAPAAPGAMVTERSRRRLEAERQRRAAAAAAGGASGGTVGACAIDAAGHVAAGTSTGGTTYKRPGRIGDTPLCGCGTYADDEGGAASATGVGEAIIRVTMTRVCVDAMRRGDGAAAAAWRAVDELRRVTGGSAGIICCDRAGRLGVALSTATMSFAAGRGERVVSGVS